MKNKRNTHGYSEHEKKRLLANIDAMKERFQGEPFAGENLALLKRKVVEQEESYRIFKKKLEEREPLLYKSLTDDTLPSHSSIYDVLAKRKEPSRRFVNDMASFCTKVFSFDETVEADDLLTKDLSPFPPLRRINERWNRYVGIYRGFYPYHGDRGPELRGALLQITEAQGVMLCRFITGVRKDSRFDVLRELLMADITEEQFAEAFEEYNKSLPSPEARLVCYKGSAELSVPGYFLFKAQRIDNQNVALLSLRRFDSSAQPHYSGGIATVTLCRSDDMVTYPMLVTQSAFSLQKDKEMLFRHLKGGIRGKAGLKLSVEMDKNWNQSIMDWCFWQEERKGKIRPVAVVAKKV